MSILPFNLTLLIFLIPMLFGCCDSSSTPKVLISDGAEKRLVQITDEQAKMAKPAAERGDKEAILTMIQWSFQKDKTEEAEFWQHALQASDKQKKGE